MALNLNLRLLTILGLAAAAIVLMAQAAFASPGNSGDTKPGWGHGDKNHTHTGPPGQSVHP